MSRSDRKKFRMKLKNRLRKYEEAKVGLSWKGSQDPDDFEVIEETARIQEKRMTDFVMNLYDAKALEEEFSAT